MRRAFKLLSIFAAVAALLLLMSAGHEDVAGRIRDILAGEPINIQGSEYTVHVAGRITASLPAGDITLTDVSLRPVKTADAEKFSCTVTVENVSLRGVVYKTDRGKQTERDSLSRKSWSLSADEITISGLSANIAGLKDSEPYSYSAEGLSLRAEGFHIDGGKDIKIDIGQSIGDKILFCDRIELVAERLSTTAGHGAVVLEVENVEADTHSGTVLFTAFRMLPQYPMLEFTPLAHDHSDWTQMELTGIVVNGLDCRRLISEKSFKADSVAIGGGYIASYKDRNTAPVREIKFFHESFQQLPVPLDIPVITFDNIEAEYIELAPGAQTPGVITVTGITCKIEGFANRTRAGEKTLSITAEGKFMGQAHMHTLMTMPVGPDYDRWTVTARLEDMDLPVLNRMVVPLMNAKVKSGQITNLEFHIEATSEGSHTTATMIYDDLHIALLRKNNHDRERCLLTFIADDLLIRDANPDSHGRLRTGEGTEERNHNRSQFNFIFKSVISGVKKTVI